LNMIRPRPSEATPPPLVRHRITFAPAIASGSAAEQDPLRPRASLGVNTVSDR
jgi:hypothetical protein